MCMSVASMSPLIIHTEARHHYRCRKCAGNVSLEDPASGSVALRMLYLYPLVGADGHASTGVHTQPVRLIVTAPPAEWAWCEGDATEVLTDERSAASPKQGWDTGGAHWRYNDAESSAIWSRAESFHSDMSLLALCDAPVPDSAKSSSAPAPGTPPWKKARRSPLEQGVFNVWSLL